MEQRITVSQAAKTIKQSTESIYQWIRDGEVSAITDLCAKRGIKMVLLSECERQADSTPVRFSLSNETHLLIEQVAHAKNISKRAATEMLVARKQNKDCRFMAYFNADFGELWAKVFDTHDEIVCWKQEMEVGQDKNDALDVACQQAAFMEEQADKEKNDVIDA